MWPHRREGLPVPFASTSCTSGAEPARNPALVKDRRLTDLEQAGGETFSLQHT